MLKSFPKILFFASAFCLLFLLAAGSSVLAQCGNYFKTTTRKILAEKVYIFEDEEAVKDLTGDGKLDIIGFVRDDATNLYTKLYILPGDGAGDFGAPIQIALPAALVDSPVPFYSASFKVADFNGDGKNDFIIHANTNPATVIVYQNNGSGGFTALTPSLLPASERFSSLVDVNGDGRGDLFTYETNSSAYYYRLGNADGTFGARVTLSRADYANGGDFNGDGKIDFPVVSASGTGAYSLQLYLNLGNGIFTLNGNSTPIDTVGSYLTKVADFNNDGKPDLLFDSLYLSDGQPRLVLLLNLGNGTFSRTELPFSYSFLSRVPTVKDFNGDGFLDIFIAAGGNGGSGYTIFTNNGAGGFTSRQYNNSYLGAAVGDFDGDNKADFLRVSNFDVYNNNSVPPKVFNETEFSIRKNICTQFGQTKIVDFDGDGIADTTFWRASDSRWRYRQSIYPNNITTVNWGAAGDVPVPGDYDADGKTDIAVYRPSTGAWYVINSSDGSYFGVSFGASEDKPVASDYNGDGRTDFAVYRPSSGIWYVLYGGTFQFYAAQFGASEDRPVPEDYDGDGKTDFAVFRPSNATWYVLKSTDLSFFGVAWGLSTDALVPADYDGDGKADITVFRNGTWYIRRSNNFPLGAFAFGASGDVPQASDWNGDGIWDLGIYRPSTKIWYTSYTNYITFGDAAGEAPLSTLNKSY